eukprot:g46778.t1
MPTVGDELKNTIFAHQEMNNEIRILYFKKVVHRPGKKGHRWQARTSSPVQHVYSKCLQLQLLGARVSELEQWLETLWSICEAESTVAGMYGEAVTPQAHALQAGRERVTIRQIKRDGQ